MNEQLTPHTALLVHGSAQQGNRLAVVTLHGIHMLNGLPSLDAGRILAPTEARDLGARLMGETPAHNDRVAFHPATLLANDDTSLTWFRPAGRCTQHWRLPKGRVTVSAVLPGLLFHVRDRRLYVAAFCGNERPHERTQLYHAPLGNVYASGEVCVGGVALPRDASPSTMAAWEAVLLASNYGHINHSAVLAEKADTDGLVAFWTKRQRYKTEPHARLLVETQLAARWLSSLGKGDN